MKAVASIVKGKHVAPGVRFLVTFPVTFIVLSPSHHVSWVGDHAGQRGGGGCGGATEHNFAVRRTQTALKVSGSGGQTPFTWANQAHVAAVTAAAGGIGDHTSGVAALTIPQRQSIATMCAEINAEFAIFPCDERLRAFLRERGGS